MFCKFCGETMEPSQVKCRKCGREAVAASQCGGYHDVVKELNKRGITDPANPPQVYVTQKAPESKVWIVTAVCALLVLISIVIMLSLANKIEALNVAIDEIDHCTCGKVIEETTEKDSAKEKDNNTGKEDKENKDEKTEKEQKEDKVEGIIDDITKGKTEETGNTNAPNAVASCTTCKGEVDENGQCTNPDCPSKTNK